MAMKHQNAPRKPGPAAPAGQGQRKPPAPLVPLADTDMERLQRLLDAVPAPLEPLDLCALDGFIAGVVLQPKPVPADQWLRWVTDVEGRPAPTGTAMDELRSLARRRFAEVEAAISDRDWFDPWVFALDDADEVAEDADGGPVQDAMLPWVAGFAAAMDAFPALMNSTNPELIEPLALLYLHFDPEDLEDADALLAVIETLEPPADLAEAVQDLVRALMLMADVTRPLEPVKAPTRPAPGQLHARGRSQAPGVPRGSNRMVAAPRKTSGPKGKS